MTKEVQEVGGDRTSQDAYTGPARMITVDTSNWDLRLHDGVTPGGYPIPNRDNNDTRYQGRSPELDGLLGFEPQERGIFVRLGPGDYRLRELTVDSDQLVVVNGNGYAGNPLISLADTIQTSHTWAVDQLFLGVIQVNGGINADLSGDVTGNLTGNVIGNVLGNVTGNLTGDSIGAHTGDVDVRGATLELDDDQIPASKIAGLIALIRLHAVDFGMIMLWSGNVVDIPVGWALCDGTDGTPDFRGKFIVGAGGAYSPGDTGGAATHTHANTVENTGDHTHAITVDNHTLTLSEIPAHRHGSGVTNNDSQVFNHGSLAASPNTSDSIENSGDNGTTEGYTTTDGGDGAHSHAGSSASAGTHIHDVDIDSSSNLPPYYVACYIMRIAD